MFYHKVLGVGTFFLFVEGKAATPSVSTVLEAIPVRSCFSYLCSSIVLLLLSCFPFLCSDFVGLIEMTLLLHSLSVSLFFFCLVGGESNLQDIRARRETGKKVCQVCCSNIM